MVTDSLFKVAKTVSVVIVIFSQDSFKILLIHMSVSLSTSIKRLTSLVVV
jgi:hypothetical protein